MLNEGKSRHRMKQNLKESFYQMLTSEEDTDGLQSHKLSLIFR